jgi:hypothetical protein
VACHDLKVDFVRFACLAHLIKCRHFRGGQCTIPHDNFVQISVQTVAAPTRKHPHERNVHACQVPPRLTLGSIIFAVVERPKFASVRSYCVHLPFPDRSTVGATKPIVLTLLKGESPSHTAGFETERAVGIDKTTSRIFTFGITKNNWNLIVGTANMLHPNRERELAFKGASCIRIAELKTSSASASSQKISNVIVSAQHKFTVLHTWPHIHTLLVWGLPNSSTDRRTSVTECREPTSQKTSNCFRSRRTARAMAAVCRDHVHEWGPQLLPLCTHYGQRAHAR